MVELARDDRVLRFHELVSRGSHLKSELEKVSQKPTKEKEDVLKIKKLRYQLAKTNQEKERELQRLQIS